MLIKCFCRYILYQDELIAQLFVFRFKTLISKEKALSEAARAARLAIKNFSDETAVVSVALEILNETGEEATPGQLGEMYITDLDNYGMPLIRYQIGEKLWQ